MKVFVIAPVRNISQDFKNRVEAFINSLETKYDKEQLNIHYPLRDTDQEDQTGGYIICSDNLKALKEADIICVSWDGKSQGCLFDLGMAFALDKPIFIIPDCFPERTGGKSFANMVRYWEDKYKYIVGHILLEQLGIEVAEVLNGK